MTEPTLPPMPELCWPVDTSCVANWDQYDEATQAFAEAMAAQALRMLTGYQVGGCPITVRPCLKGCSGSSYLIAPVWYGSMGTGALGFYPHIAPNGAWVNACGCQTEDCSCSRLCEVVLYPPVGDVIEVRVDGQVLDDSAYRVDDGNKLVRTDADCWPQCQNMKGGPDDPDTFFVTYLNSQPVDGLGAVAAGILAGEFAKACSGKACSLPRGVTEIARQGVTFTVATGTFPDGLTGILTVDAFIKTYNPHALKMAPRVYSPDVVRPRQTTWPHA